MRTPVLRATQPDNGNTVHGKSLPLLLLLLLVLAAVVMALLYELTFVAPYPLATSLHLWRESWARHVGGGASTAVRHAASMLVLFGLYLASLAGAARLQPTRTAQVIVWASWLATALLLLRGLPGDSLDIFDYLFRGRMMSEYGASPLNAIPRAFIDKPFARHVTWMDWVDAYGPLWEGVSAALAWLVAQTRVGNELVLAHNVTCADTTAVCTLLEKYLQTYRLFALACSAAMAMLLSRLVLPRWRVLVLAGWLWNPLVLVSTAIGGHNETWAWLWVGIALLCVRNNNRQPLRIALATLCIGLAAHVKITQLLLLLPLTIWLLQPNIGHPKDTNKSPHLASLIAHRLSQLRSLPSRARVLLPMLLALALMLPISWLLYEPFGGWATLPRNLYERSQLSDNSIAHLFAQGLQSVAGWQEFAAETAVGRIAQVVSLLLLGLWAWRQLRSDTSRSLPQLCLEALVVYLLIGGFWFQFWYLQGPLLLVLCLDPSDRQGRARLGLVVAWCASSMLAALLEDFVYNASPALPSTTWVPYLAASIQFLPWISALVIRGRGLATSIQIFSKWHQNPGKP